MKDLLCMVASVIAMPRTYQGLVATEYDEECRCVTMQPKLSRNFKILKAFPMCGSERVFAAPV
jgi:hypothetical protein